MNNLLIGIGGFLGTVLRYSIVGWILGKPSNTRHIHTPALNRCADNNRGCRQKRENRRIKPRLIEIVKEGIVNEEKVRIVLYGGNKTKIEPENSDA